MIEFVRADEVATYLGQSTPDTIHLPGIVAAVNSYLQTLHHLSGADEPTPEARQGAKMLAARLHRRRNSLGGIETMDGSPAYIARTDPDIARLLKLDAFAPWVVA